MRTSKSTAAILTQAEQRLWAKSWPKFLKVLLDRLDGIEAGQ
jgi:hypothetical protein